MITDDYSVEEILQHLPVKDCNYQEWIDVGMALKTAGMPVDLWDDWSRDDKRYHDGECAKKWESFKRNEKQIGSIVDLALRSGWKPGQKDKGYALSWDDAIGGGSAAERKKAVDENWMQVEEVPGPPSDWHPAEQVKRYLKALFQPSEYVGICTEMRLDDDVLKPTRGNCKRTCAQLLKEIDKYGDDLGYSIGEINPEAGAYVRFNPLDGQGVADKNVTAFRYAVIESDDMTIEKQYSVLKALQLPIRILVHSGNKSLHAIIRVDAADYDEYRKRVDYLYKTCQDNGMSLDRQNRNPSRLSRLPGVMRNGKPQYIIAENMGLPSWDAWKDYIEGLNDELPEIMTFGDLTELPDLDPELIQGVLRVGHKMILSGPSKAGKSFLLMELAICIAEGIPWLGYSCLKGRVLYVNLEIEQKSCEHRLDEIYRNMGLQERSRNLDVWNLRGVACPMDELTPKLIRRAKSKHYIAVIIDPLYKVITGDENSAEEMAKFFNLFDRVAHQLSCSVIYCHHHSKGNQGWKNAMDRASGSGVFGRDPDAILDMIELEINDSKREDLTHRQTDIIAWNALDEHCQGWQDVLGAEGVKNHLKLLEHARTTLPNAALIEMNEQIDLTETRMQNATAWRIESTLREFPPAPPTRIWFNYPIHIVDSDGILQDLHARGERATIKEAREAKQSNSEAKKETRIERKWKEFEKAWLEANNGEPPTLEQFATKLGKTTQNTSKQMKELGFTIDMNKHIVVKPEKLIID